MIFEWRDAPKVEFAVIGDPIDHSKSPLIHNAALRHLGLPYQYVAIRVPLEEAILAAEHLRHLGYLGLNVTVPLKKSLFHWARQTDLLSQRLKALNTLDLRTGLGTNTDAQGFAATLREHAIASDRPAVVLGAGGSARAIVAVLSGLGFPIRMWNRTRSRAEALLRDLGITAEVMESPRLDDAGLIVSCLTGNPPVRLDLDWSTVSKNAVAYDLMYGRITPFLEGAVQAGHATIDGTEMLVEQAALALESWIGKPVPRSVMLNALKESAQ